MRRETEGKLIKMKKKSELEKTLNEFKKDEIRNGEITNRTHRKGDK